MQDVCIFAKHIYHSEMKTHHKKLANPNYFGSYAMPIDGKDVILTIDRVVQEEIINTDGKKSKEPVAYFRERTNPVTGEPQKPMILNATNRKAIAKLAKSPYVEDWAGVQIQIYVDKVKAFGDIHDALRIRSMVNANIQAPKPLPPQI